MILWTEQAAADLTGQLEWLNSRNPDAAARVGDDVLGAVQRLETYPHSGRVGRRLGTRELICSPRSYVVIYKVVETEVVVLRVLHGAQLWP